MDRFRRGDLVFDVEATGPVDAPVAVLLHGHPQTNTAWEAVVPHLVRSGFRCVVPNQRGMSPGARPRRRRQYRMSELVQDVGALVDAIGAQRVHVVGHDFGGLVAWSFAAKHPGRVSTLSSLSSPHPRALQAAIMTSRQSLLSWYLYAYQVPRIPEWFYLGPEGTGDRLIRMLVAGGQRPDLAARDARAMTEPGAYTAALNWYRAVPWSGSTPKVAAPTQMVWSDGDKYILEKPARRSGRYVTGEFRFEVLAGSHWLPDEQPKAVADLLVDWFARFP